MHFGLNFMVSRLFFVVAGLGVLTGCFFPDHNEDHTKLLRAVVEEIAADNKVIEVLEIDKEAAVASIRHIPTDETFTIDVYSLYDGSLDLDINGVKQAFTFNADELAVDVRGGTFVFTSGGSTLTGNDGSGLWNYDAVDVERYPEWLPRIEPLEPISIALADGDNYGSYQFVFHGSEDELLAKIASAFADKGLPRSNRVDQDGEIVLVYDPPEPNNAVTLTLQPSPESIWRVTVDYL